MRSIELEKAPAHWISATGKYFVREKDGNKVLVKTPVQRGLNKSNVYFGPPTMNNYQIQVDMMGTRDKRRMPDMGINLQSLHVRHARQTAAFTNTGPGHPIYAWQKQLISLGR